MDLRQFVAIGDTFGGEYGLSLTLAADPATGKAREGDTSLHAYVLWLLATTWEEFGDDPETLNDPDSLADAMEMVDLMLSVAMRDLQAVRELYREQSRALREEKEKV